MGSSGVRPGSENNGVGTVRGNRSGLPSTRLSALNFRDNRSADDLSAESRVPRCGGRRCDREKATSGL